jgi:hypothetical protein
MEHVLPTGWTKLLPTARPVVEPERITVSICGRGPPPTKAYALVANLDTTIASNLAGSAGDWFVGMPGQLENLPEKPAGAGD